MRRFWIVCLMVAGLSLPCWAQKIETQKHDRSHIVHVATALGHLTVIEVGEPVTSVAAGSPTFKIEWRENRVFIEPTEPNVATNLFIWTNSGRLSYELEPAGSIEQMDFAIDQPQPQPAPSATAPAARPSTPTNGAVDTDAVLGWRPVWVEESKGPKDRVIVLVKDIIERDNEFFVRYAVRNDTTQPYELATPQLFVLDVSNSAPSLHSNSQLTAKETARLRITGQASLPVVDGHVRSARIGPGQETVGVVALKLPARSSRTVLRLVFGNDGRGQPTATLVL